MKKSAKKSAKCTKCTPAQRAKCAQANPCGTKNPKTVRTKVYAVKVNAGVDANGNSRRGWLVYKPDGTYLGFVDEGYRGWAALKTPFPKAIVLCEIPTSPGTYRTLRRE